MTPTAARLRLRALARLLPPAEAGRLLAAVAALPDDTPAVALAMQASAGEADAVTRALLGSVERVDPPPPAPGTPAAWMAEELAAYVAKRGTSPHPFGTGYGAIERATEARKRRGD